MRQERPNGIRRERKLRWSHFCERIVGHFALSASLRGEDELTKNFGLSEPYGSSSAGLKIPKVRDSTFRAK